MHKQKATSIGSNVVVVLLAWHHAWEHLATFTVSFLYSADDVFPPQVKRLWLHLARSTSDTEVTLGGKSIHFLQNKKCHTVSPPVESEGLSSLACTFFYSPANIFLCSFIFLPPSIYSFSNQHRHSSLSLKLHALPPQTSPRNSSFLWLLQHLFPLADSITSKRSFTFLSLFTWGKSTKCGQLNLKEGFFLT